MMTTNRTRAEALCQPLFFAEGNSVVREELVDNIELALNQAEQRGRVYEYNVHARHDNIAKSELAATLDEILDRCTFPATDDETYDDGFVDGWKAAAEIARKAELI